MQISDCRLQNEKRIEGRKSHEASVHHRGAETQSPNFTEANEGNKGSGPPRGGTTCRSKCQRARQMYARHLSFLFLRGSSSRFYTRRAFSQGGWIVANSHAAVKFSL